MQSELKERFLELLDKDKEFRYAVAGYLGISEILKRLDNLAEGQNKLWEEIRNIWEEIKGLRENQEKLLENQHKLWEEVRKLREDQSQMRVTLERLTLSLEDEARDVISYRIKKELGIEIKLDRIFIDEIEVNIYGANDEICLVGEATVRLDRGLIEELEEKIRRMKEKKPELLKPKIIKVIYASFAIPSALELASKLDIWVLNWKGDLLPRKIVSI